MRYEVYNENQLSKKVYVGIQKESSKPTKMPKKIYITPLKCSKLLMNVYCYNYNYTVRLEYQNIKHLLDKTTDQPSKFRTRKLVEVSDVSNETYKTGKQIDFYTLMLNSSLCDFIGACIVLKGAITIAGTAQRADKRNKQVTFKYCASFTSCISQANHTQVDGTGYLDIVMSIFSPVECSNNYAEAGGLWQGRRDALGAATASSGSFKS